MRFVGGEGGRRFGRRGGAIIGERPEILGARVHIRHTRVERGLFANLQREKVRGALPEPFVLGLLKQSGQLDVARRLRDLSGQPRRER